MAHGTLKTRIKSLVPLVSSIDSSLIVEDKGAGFALRYFFELRLLLYPEGQGDPESRWKCGRAIVE
jgi:hypothetical protein